jgi:hypothetical protein
VTYAGTHPHLCATSRLTHPKTPNQTETRPRAPKRHHRHPASRATARGVYRGWNTKRAKANGDDCTNRRTPRTTGTTTTPATPRTTAMSSCLQGGNREQRDDNGDRDRDNNNNDWDNNGDNRDNNGDNRDNNGDDCTNNTQDTQDDHDHDHHRKRLLTGWKWGATRRGGTGDPAPGRR